MKPRRIFSAARLSLPFASALVALFAAPSGMAAVRYWDPSSGGTFGSVTGTDTWATSTNLIWTASNTGNTTRLANYTTTTADDLNFGGPTASLGAGTVPVGTVSAGTISFNTLSGNMLLSGGTITMKAAATITTVNASQAHTISSEITGAATSLTKAGDGRLILSGVNTYIGRTFINAGTLTLGNTNTLGTIPGTNGSIGITMAAGTNLQSGSATGSNNIIAAPITLSGAGDTTLSVGTGAGSTTTTFTLDGAIGGTTGNLVFSTGTGSFSNRSSVFVLNAASNYTGNTLITTGNGGNNPVFVRNGVVNALPSTTVLTLDGGNGGGTGRTIQYDLNGFDQTLAGLTNNTAVTLRNQRVTNTSATAAVLTLDGNGNSTYGGTFSGTTTTRAQIVGNLSLVKTGAGTFTLTDAHTYTGSTTITGGILAPELAASLPGYTTSGKVIFNGGRLNIASGDGTTTGWSDAQVATLLSNATKTSGTLGINTANGDVIETAFDFGGLSLVKTGANTLTLNQAHTLGGTTIANNGGTVKITDAAALGAGNVTIQTNGTNTGTLELALTGTNTISNTFSGFNSATTLAGGGNAQIVNTSGTNTISSDLTIANTGGNGLNVVSDGGLLTLSGTITHTIASIRSFSIGGSGDGEVSGAILNNATGNVSLAVNKTGAGTWTISNASNSYTGNTNVAQGTLIVDGNISTSVTTVASGATIAGSGTVGALSVQSGGFIAPGNSPGILNSGNYTQAGTYNAEITGLTAGPLGHDQIIVTGTVDISNGSLATLFSGTYAANDLIFLLLNDDTDAITGTYTGLAQGDVASTYGGFNWQISYVADSVGSSFTGGNDIALMAVVIPEPSAALLGGLGALLLLRRRRS
ncbi:autotransporter-associated beta strand repeat-containing protein [Akkermansiaceae bacterium]|nr:autotransporter-associated beta strand repeat-containing protein [Akkermansiaceae bacterium]